MFFILHNITLLLDFCTALERKRFIPRLKAMFTNCKCTSEKNNNFSVNLNVL